MYLLNKAVSPHKQKHMDSVHSWPAINQFQSCSHGGKPPSLSLPTLLSHSIFLWQNQISRCPPSSDVFSILLYFSVSSHSSSLLPFTAPGTMTMEILFWESVSPWLVKKWLKSTTQTQYLIGGERANPTLALLCRVSVYVLHYIHSRLEPGIMAQGYFNTNPYLFLHVTIWHNATLVWGGVASTPSLNGFKRIAPESRKQIKKQSFLVYLIVT